MTTGTSPMAGSQRIKQGKASLIGGIAVGVAAFVLWTAVAHELAANACWIQVRTDRGVESALTFYADPVDAPVARLPVEEQARLLATAAGAAGSGAEYLLRTARGLAEWGIEDDYIWTLQHLVAERIEAKAGFVPPTCR